MNRLRHSKWLAFVLLASAAVAAQGASAGPAHVPDIRTAEAAGQVWVAGAWGTTPGDFGMVDDASRPGPMDFALHGDLLYVLDPVNSRVQVFDARGELDQVIPIGTRTADFICVDSDGSVVVLDAFVQRELRVFTPAGELATKARLPKSLRLPSAIFADHGQYLVEERHSRVLALNLDRGQQDQTARPVTALRGRPRAADSGTTHACKLGPLDVVLEHANVDDAREEQTVRFPYPIRSIVALESDQVGNTYVAAACLRDPPADGQRADIVIAALTPAGQLLGALTIPDQYVTDHYRKLLVTPTGDVLQMQTTEAGVRFIRWRMPALAAEGGAQ